ncbi:MAG TPA: aspartate/glutamate racemase family protein [Solirubrobacter sp.]|jgi:maleate isomerase|nr:aspartate/glutamate racemase family protein [Solirubrobacter sp.]
MARAGLVVPSSNTVMEVDFYRALPSDVTLHTARMYMVETTPEGEAAMLDDYLPAAIRDLASARPDVVVFGCTSAGALRGKDYEAELIRRMAEETGAKAISVANAVGAAISRRGAKRVGVVTPYVDSLNEPIRASLEADGLDVVGIHGLGIDENFEIASVEPARVAEFAAECFDGTGVDLVFASCTNFRALEARERIEELLGVPAMTSNLAALEAVMDALPTASGV